MGLPQLGADGAGGVEVVHDRPVADPLELRVACDDRRFGRCHVDVQPDANRNFGRGARGGGSARRSRDGRAQLGIALPLEARHRTPGGLHALGVQRLVGNRVHATVTVDEVNGTGALIDILAGPQHRAVRDGGIGLVDEDVVGRAATVSLGEGPCAGGRVRFGGGDRSGGQQEGQDEDDAECSDRRPADGGR